MMPMPPVFLIVIFHIPNIATDPHSICWVMVKVTFYLRIIDCHWDVRHVTPGALNALLDHLISLESPRNDQTMVALKFYFGAWNSEVYTTPGHAVERMVELSEYANAIPGETITIANVDLDLIGQSHSIIHSTLDKWKTMNGVLGDDPQNGLGELNDLCLLLEHDSLGERLVYKSAGIHSMASSLLGQNWRYMALGMPSDRCYSDDDYESEVCSDYPVVMASGEPRLDHIRAYFRLDDDDPMWLNYERLLLPWKTKSGEALIMCCSQRNQNLSIPFLEAALDQAV